MSLSSKIDQFDRDSTLFNAWMHGPATGVGSVVTTDSGTVRTPAKLIADLSNVVLTGGPLEVQTEGVAELTVTSVINFTGAGVTVIASGNTVNVDIPGLIEEPTTIQAAVPIGALTVYVGSSATVMVTIDGVMLGDFVQFAAPYDISGLIVTAHVQSVGAIALCLRNDIAVDKELLEGTWKFRITRI